MLHVSGIILHLMQCHVGSLLMWKKERGKRKRDRCFTKQSPHELKFRTMRQLILHYCTSDIPLLHILRTLELLRDNLKDNSLYLLHLKSSHNYVALHETLSMRQHQYTYPNLLGIELIFIRIYIRR